jgi:hypothetical protein
MKNQKSRQILSEYMDEFREGQYNLERLPYGYEFEEGIERCNKLDWLCDIWLDVSDMLDAAHRLDGGEYDREEAV